MRIHLDFDFITQIFMLICNFLCYFIDLILITSHVLLFHSFAQSSIYCYVLIKRAKNFMRQCNTRKINLQRKMKQKWNNKIPLACLRFRLLNNNDKCVHLISPVFVPFVPFAFDSFLVTRFSVYSIAVVPFSCLLSSGCSLPLYSYCIFFLSHSHIPMPLFFSKIVRLSYSLFLHSFFDFTFSIDFIQSLSTVFTFFYQSHLHFLPLIVNFYPCCYCHWFIHIQNKFLYFSWILCFFFSFAFTVYLWQFSPTRKQCICMLHLIFCTDFNDNRSMKSTDWQMFEIVFT